MPEHDPLADEAAQYVLGGLNDAERVMFESRLAHTPELRAQVRELNEGMVALAMTAPRRQPPAAAWKEIERAIAREAGWNAIRQFNNTWWRNGWAAAVACLVGWLLYAVWLHRPAQNVPLVPEFSQNSVSTNRVFAPTDLVAQRPRPVAVREQPSPAQAALARQTEALRQELASLKSQMSQMSTALAQQQAMLAETNRLKFMQFSPAVSGDTANLSQLSPALQRALFLAMARELGWLPTEGAQPNNLTGVVSSTNGWNVDFLDLRPGANNPSTSVTQQKNEINNSAESTSSSPTVASSTIPGFVSGNNLVLAIDSSVMPKGNPITFSSPGSGSQFPTDYTVGDNPLVITLPAGNFLNATGGYSIDIITSGNGPNSNTLHFTIPPNNP